MKGKVLDVPALVDFATGRTGYTRAVVRTANFRVFPIAIPTAALAVAWAVCDAGARTRLAVLCETASAVIISLGEDEAASAGELLEHAAQVGPIDIAAGQVAALGRDRAWAVLTDRGPQLRTLVPGLEIEPLP